MNEKIKLLYVDDEPINLFVFRAMFSKKYDLVTCSSGAEALKQINQESGIKVVISDMNMPGMNGLEFIEKAKSEFPDIVFMLLTGYGLTDEIRKAMDERLIRNYFSKPLDTAAMELSIQKLFREKGNLSEVFFP